MNAVFTISGSSGYDDLPEVRYHFPSSYLNQVKQSVGDWIVYYESRRKSGPSSADGRQAYVAMARVERIVADQSYSNLHYAFLNDYIEFDAPVPFREGSRFFESALAKADGTTSKGAFGRAVRTIPRAEFDAIIAAGFARPFDPWDVDDTGPADEPDSERRRRVENIVSRPFRDKIFRRRVREEYSNKCAVTGLCLVNGGGRPEVQAAHIKPVEENGPDRIQNGIALTGTVHWLFDRGVISIDDSFRVLLAPAGVPESLVKLMNADKRLNLPLNPDSWPHRKYLAWHRESRFKG